MVIEYNRIVRSGKPLLRARGRYHEVCTWYIVWQPVAPMAYQVTVEPGIGQFREFESRYSNKFVGTCSFAQIDVRKARERDLATLDEKSTSSGIAEPYAQ